MEARKWVKTIERQPYLLLPNMFLFNRKQWAMSWAITHSGEVISSIELLCVGPHVNTNILMLKIFGLSHMDRQRGQTLHHRMYSAKYSSTVQRQKNSRCDLRVHRTVIGTHAAIQSAVMSVSSTEGDVEDNCLLSIHLHDNYMSVSYQREITWQSVATSEHWHDVWTCVCVHVCICLCMCFKVCVSKVKNVR